MPHQTTGLDQVGLQALAVVPFFRIEPANDITAGGTVRILGVIRGRQSAVHQAAPCEAPLAVAFSDLPAQLPHRQRPTVQKVGATREGSNGTLRCSSLELWATELWLNCINQEYHLIVLGPNEAFGWYMLDLGTVGPLIPVAKRMASDKH